VLHLAVLHLAVLHLAVLHLALLLMLRMAGLRVRRSSLSGNGCGKDERDRADNCLHVKSPIPKNWSSKHQFQECFGGGGSVPGSTPENASTSAGKAGPCGGSGSPAAGASSAGRLAQPVQCICALAGPSAGC
jgi:hypothetical protein